MDVTSLLYVSLLAYIVGEEADCHAYDEHRPEDMKTLQNHQKSVEKVVAEEGFIHGHWVNPRTVNNPAEDRVGIDCLNNIHI